MKGEIAIRIDKLLSEAFPNKYMYYKVRDNLRFYLKGNQEGYACKVINNEQIEGVERASCIHDDDGFTVVFVEVVN